MAERRRRRKLTEDSDDASDDSDGKIPIERSDLGSDGGNSEYESVEEDELANEEEEDEEEEGLQDPLSGDQDKQLDDDEDRKNPQYIPKKGTFYEHDDRTMPEDGEPESKESEKTPAVLEKKEPKKKMWKDDDRWQHDRYNLYDQSPKSRDELVTLYGYDIRDEDGPPRARRRRRYGRGPNKYTRNWEDFDAYSKQTRGGGAPGKPPGVGRGSTGSPMRGNKGRGRAQAAGRARKPAYTEEEFPALGSKEVREERVTNEEMNSPQILSMTITNENHKFNSANANIDDHHDVKTNHGSFSPVEDKMRDVHSRGRGGPRRINRASYRGGVGRGYPRQTERQYDDAPASNGKHRGGGVDQPMGGRPESKRGSVGVKDRLSNPKGQPGHGFQHRGEVHDLTNEVKSMTITPSKEEFQYKGKRGNDNRRNPIPPRLQDTMRGGAKASPSPPIPQDGGSSKPKRYSSQRQRGVQDQGSPYQGHQGFYDQGNSEHRFQNNLYDGPSQSVMAHNVTLQSSPHTIGGSGPPSFVAPSFTTAPATYPPEPFLGQTPSPRMFPPVSQSHLIGPVPAGPPPPLAGAAVPPAVTGPAAAAAAAGVPGPPIPPVTGPPFLPPENMLNYGAGVVAQPHPPQFPPFQPFTPVTQPQPQEIYSNGVMYYNTQSQQHLPRVIQPLQKRPKAAIPIVPPPDREDNPEATDISQAKYKEMGEDDDAYLVGEEEEEYADEEYDSHMPHGGADYELREFTPSNLSEESPTHELPEEGACTNGTAKESPSGTHHDGSPEGLEGQGDPPAATEEPAAVAVCSAELADGQWDKSQAEESRTPDATATTAENQPQVQSETSAELPSAITNQPPSNDGEKLCSASLAKDEGEVSERKEPSAATESMSNPSAESQENAT